MALDHLIGSVKTDVKRFRQLLYRHNIRVVVQHLHTRLKRLAAVIWEHFPDTVIDAAQKSCIADRFFQLHNGVLLFNGDVADDEHP